MTTMETQYAVQLVGKDQIKLNTAKPITEPGDHEMLLKVEAVGLCFSDLKLLKQFDEHGRKSEIVAGLDTDVLQNVQSYVPGDKPTVPGHEVVARIVKVGSKVKQHAVGERVLVQTDYRDLKTAASNSAFGYNFEGGLQEYVIVDERVAIDSQGERFLIPVDDEGGSSSVALVEPWACVEDSYVNQERQGIKPGGKLLIVASEGTDTSSLDSSASGQIVTVMPEKADEVEDESFDDIVYFGSDAAVIEVLNDKLAKFGMINIVLGGKKIGRPVNIGVGRVHYGYTRWVGTIGSDADESYSSVPKIDEIRENDKILIIGAGGPMGQMHVIRNVCSGIKGIEVVGTDFDDARLASVEAKAKPLADAAGVNLRLVNPQNTPIEGETFSYFAIMAPVAKLLEGCIADAEPGAIINIFAGIPAPVKHELDLDSYIQKGLFMFGTSGSVIEDMKIVLRKVESGQLNTNSSVDAVSGMAGAEDGIRAVENRTLAGKIIVYPQLRELGLTPLSTLAEMFPTVAEKLNDGIWTKEAEAELLTVAK